jgi:hypothetical protein
MVTPGASRCAPLRQREVDDFARGQPGEAAQLLRAARFAKPEAEARATTGSSPVPLAAKDMQAIVRSGAASGRLLSASLPGPRPRRSRMQPRRAPGRSAPALKPPDYSERRSR